MFMNSNSFEVKNYYNILGIERTATEGEIKKAYKGLARECHPDMGDGSSEEKFKDINEAKEILSDSGRRREYDEDLKRQERFEARKEAGSKEEMRRAELRNADTENVLDSLFGSPTL